MYASCMAAVMPRHLDLAAKYNVNLLGAVTWAFEFEDQPYFDGFRDLATNGIDKPVLNVHRMLAMMTGDRVAVENPGAAALDSMLAESVKQKPDIHAMASRAAHSVAVIVSNYHDSGKRGPSAPVDLVIAGLPHDRVFVERFLVDDDHSNSYEVWKKMGSPQQPTPEQYTALERAGHLHMADSPRWVQAKDGQVRASFNLQRHGVSLIRVTW